MLTPSNDRCEYDITLAPRRPRPSVPAAAACAPEFAPTESMFDPVDDVGAWSTARWVEEQEALAAAAVRRAAHGPARRTADLRSPRPARRETARRRGNWLLRFEATLHRLLPAGFGSLLGLFLCVSLSMALISAMLPLVDRL